MAQKFKETAHLHTDMAKYGENYDRVFNKKADADTVGESSNSETEERARIKDLARVAYYECSGEQGSEGFPESSSFIYGYIQGYKAAKEGK